MRCRHNSALLLLVCVMFMCLLFFQRLQISANLCPECPINTRTIFQEVGMKSETNVSIHEVKTFYYKNKTPTHFLINCSNIQQIVIGGKLGLGVSKYTYAGSFHGLPVAVKIISPEVSDIKTCIKKLPGNPSYTERDATNKDCFTFPILKLMKEILLLSQLEHPGFIQLLGYCVRNEQMVSTPDLKRHGVVAVYEKAARLDNLRHRSLTEKVTLSLQLLELLDYLEHSPLGSLVMQDLKDTNLMLVDGQIKISDLDDLSAQEPPCGDGRKACGFELPCVGGECVGENAATNMMRATQRFFSVLLKCDDAAPQKNALAVLEANMKKGRISAKSALETLQTIQATLQT